MSRGSHNGRTSRAQLKQYVFSRFRGQGTFEYVLLLGGVLLIVVLALVVLQSSFFQASSGVSDVESKKCRLSAQQALSCFENGAFDGGNTFDLLGYQANPLLCNCSDFNPNAFSVSVGQALLKTLDFSSLKGGVSSLSFEDAPPATAYAVSIPLPAGVYTFFLVNPDRSVVPIEPDAVTALGDGRVAYSWNSLPSGSRIKVNPVSGISVEQRDQAVAQKSQVPDAQVLEQQAEEKIDKAIDSQTGLKLFKSSDGLLRLVFVYTSADDYVGSLSVTLPVSATFVSGIFPQASGVVPDGQNPGASVASWDEVHLKAGRPFRVIVLLKPEAGSVQAVLDELDVQIPKVKSNAVKRGRGLACIAVSKSCIPGGIGGSCCGSLSCELEGVGFVCKSKTDSGSSGSASSGNVLVTVSPTASPTPGACITEMQGCAATSNLPGSIDKKCCKDLSCKTVGEGLGALLTWQCQTDAGVPESYSIEFDPSTTLTASWSRQPQDPHVFIFRSNALTTPTPLASISNDPTVSAGPRAYDLPVPFEWQAKGTASISPEPSRVEKLLPSGYLSVTYDLPPLEVSVSLKAPHTQPLGEQFKDFKAHARIRKVAADKDKSKPVLDISKFNIVNSEPWVWFDVKDPTPTPTPTPVPPEAKIARESKEELVVVGENWECGDEVEGQKVSCQAGLQCLPLSSLPDSKTVCQKPETAKIYAAANAPASLAQFEKTEWSFAPDATSTAALTLNPNVDFTGFASDFKANIPDTMGPVTPVDFMTDKKGNLYAVLTSRYDSATYSNYFRTYLNAYGAAFSKDGGKKWSFSGMQLSFPNLKNYDSEQRTLAKLYWSKIQQRNACYTDKCDKAISACVDSVKGTIFARSKYPNCDPTACGYAYDKKASTWSGRYNGGSTCWLYNSCTCTCAGYSEKCEADRNTCYKACDPGGYPKVPNQSPLVDDGEITYLGSAPAEKEGIYLFYSTYVETLHYPVTSQDFMETWKRRTTGFDSVQSSKYEVHALHLTDQGVVGDSLIHSQENGAVGAGYFWGNFVYTLHPGLLYLGSQDGKYYFCQSYGDAKRCAVLKEPTLFATEEIGKPLKKIGVFGYSASDVYVPFTKLLIGPEDQLYAYDGLAQVTDSKNKDVKAKKDLGLYAFKDGVFVETIHPLIPGVTDPTLLWPTDSVASTYVKTGWIYPGYAFDASGNLHVAYSVDDAASGTLYYRVFPKSRLQGDSPGKYDVHVFGKNTCIKCNALKNFLRSSGVTFKENSEGALPDSIRSEVLAAQKDPNEPVMAILKPPTDYRVTVGFDRPWLEVALELQLDPQKVAQNAFSLSSEQKTVTATQPSWLDPNGAGETYTYTVTTYSYSPVINPVVLIENNQPVLISQNGADLFKFTPDAEKWKSSSLAQGLQSMNLNQDSGGTETPSLKRHLKSQVGHPGGRPLVSVSDLSLYFASGKISAKYTRSDGTPEDPVVYTYNVYSTQDVSAFDPEPIAGSVLSELVPYQRLQLPIPIQGDATPTVSVSTEPAGLATATVEGAYYADVTIDARSYLKGGKLDISGSDKVKGKVVAKSGKQSVDMPFEVAVKHVAPEFLAYATPDKLTFYAYQEKGVKKQIFLVNNFDRPLTLACSGVFSNVVPAKTLVAVDVKTPAQTTACTVTLDGVPIRQVVELKKVEMDYDSSYTKEDSLVDSLDFGQAVRFNRCSDAACSCQQVGAAADHFQKLLASHVAAMNGAQTRKSGVELHPSGWKEKWVVRTRPFEDLGKDTDLCKVKLAGFEFSLKPGAVYEFTVNVPNVLGWLAVDAASPQFKLLSEWAYATRDGIKSDESSFRGTLS